jgi:succinate-semialdehyde dehydrogenase/glutarate-semialdehyde dehydrogenase
LWRTKGYINGIWTDGDAEENGYFSVHNPANGEIIANLPKMSVEEAEEAAEVAFESWQTWKKTTAKERGKIISNMASLMLKYQDDLATIITLEAGKPFAESKGEVLYAASFYEFFGEEAKRS